MVKYLTRQNEWIPFIIHNANQIEQENSLLSCSCSLNPFPFILTLNLPNDDEKKICKKITLSLLTDYYYDEFMISHLFFNGLNHNYTNEFEKYNRYGMLEGMLLLLI